MGVLNSALRFGTVDVFVVVILGFAATASDAQRGKFPSTAGLVGSPPSLTARCRGLIIRTTARGRILIFMWRGLNHMSPPKTIELFPELLDEQGKVCIIIMGVSRFREHIWDQHFHAFIRKPNDTPRSTAGVSELALQYS